MVLIVGGTDLKGSKCCCHIVPGNRDVINMNNHSMGGET